MISLGKSSGGTWPQGWGWAQRRRQGLRLSPPRAVCPSWAKTAEAAHAPCPPMTVSSDRKEALSFPEGRESSQSGQHTSPGPHWGDGRHRVCKVVWEMCIWHFQPLLWAGGF